MAKRALTRYITNLTPPNTPPNPFWLQELVKRQSVLTQGRSVDHSSKDELLLRSVCGSKCPLNSHQQGEKFPCLEFLVQQVAMRKILQ